MRRRVVVLFALSLFFVGAMCASAHAGQVTKFGDVVSNSTYKVTAQEWVTFTTYSDGYTWWKPSQCTGKFWCRDYVVNHDYVRASVPYAYMYVKLWGLRPGVAASIRVGSSHLG